jgi:hypothetical protein
MPAPGATPHSPKALSNLRNDPAPINHALVARPVASKTAQIFFAAVPEQMNVSLRGPCLALHTFVHHSSNHRKRRVCIGSRLTSRSGGDAHSFMTFGLCTRNEKCAPAPLTNQALPRCFTRFACGLPAGYLKVARGSVWRRYPHDRPGSMQGLTRWLKLILFSRGFR